MSMMMLFDATSRIKEIIVTIMVGILIILLMYCIIRYWKHGGKWVFMSIVGILLLSSSAYCGMSLNTYYSARGGIYGVFLDLYQPNRVEIVDCVEYDFKHINLKQEQGQVYGATMQSDEVLNIKFDENTNYAVYVNGMPCYSLEVNNDYLIAEYKYNFLDENFEDLGTDTLYFRFAFYTNSTYLHVYTEGGANNADLWSAYFNKNTFVVKIDNKGYGDKTLSTSSGESSGFSIVNYYVEDELYLTQVYKNGDLIRLPNHYYVTDWFINNSVVDADCVVVEDMSVIGLCGNIPGLYSSSGKLIYSWKDLLSNNILKVTDDGSLIATSNTSNSLNGCLVVDNSVTNIDYNTFKDCVCLTSLELPYSIKSGFTGVDVGCSSLNKVIVNSDYIYVNNVSYYSVVGDNRFNFIKEIYVLKNIVDNPNNHNSAMNYSGSNCDYIKTISEDGKYYIYTSTR